MPVQRHVILALLLLLLSTHSSSSSSPSSEPKTVSVQVLARWNGTSLLDEAAEFIAKYSTATFWRFLDQIAEASSSAVATPESQVAEATAFAVQQLGPTRAAMLQLALAARSYSPAIEMHRHHFDSHVSRTVLVRAGDDSSPSEARQQAAARVAALRQCENVVFLRGDFVCGREFVVPSERVEYESMAEFTTAQDELVEPELFEFDRVRAALGDAFEVGTSGAQYERITEPSTKAPSLATAVLYGDPTTASFASLHTKLSVAAEQGLFFYVYRPFSSAAGAASAMQQRRLPVPGYGVEFTIKNMEYKVIDDAKVSDDDDVDVAALNAIDAGGKDSKELEREIGGFYFKTLLKRKPDLQSELEALRSHMLEREEKSVKAWDMRDLGYQASQRILASSDPLGLMQQLAENFPMYGTALARIRVDKGVKRAITSNQKRLERVGLGAGRSYLEINGVPLKISHGGTRSTQGQPGETEGIGGSAGAAPGGLDLFALAELLAQEATTLDSLAVSLPTSDSGNQDLIKKLLCLRVYPESGNDASELRIQMDLQHSIRDDGVITWVNDIEDPHENRYISWSDTVRELLSRGWPNQLRYIRKNLYHCIMVVDPTTAGGLAALEKAIFFVQHNAPIRVGFVFAANDDDSGKDDSGISSSLSKEERKMLKRRVAITRLRRAQRARFPDEKWSELWTSTLRSSDGEIDMTYGSTAYEKQIKKLEDGSGATGKADLVRLISRCVHFLENDSGEHAANKHAVEFVSALHELVSSSGGDTSRKLVRKAFRTVASKGEWKTVKKAHKAGATDGAVGKFLSAQHDYVAQRGLTGRDAFLVINGNARHTSAARFRDDMMRYVLQDQQFLQMQVYRGYVNDGTNLAAYWDTQPGTYPRANPVILQPPRDSVSGKRVDEKRMFTYIAPVSKSRAQQLPVHYYSSSTGAVAAATYWAVVDLSSPVGHSLALAALEHLSSSPRVHSRVALIPAPGSLGHALARQLALSLFAASVSETDSLQIALDALRLVVSLPDRRAQSAALTHLLALRGVAVDGDVESRFNALVQRQERELFGDLLAGIASGNSLVANGRVVSFPMVYKADEFGFDFALLDQILDEQGRANELAKLLGQDADLVFSVASTLAARSAHLALSDAVDQNKLQALSAMDTSKLLSPETCAVQLPATGFKAIGIDSEDMVPFELVAVLDPLSEMAQRAVAMVSTLHAEFGFAATVYMNPRNDQAEVPLKRFYRFAMPSRLQFDDVGEPVVVSSAASSGCVDGTVVFRNVRSRNVLTAAMDTPDSWIVMASKARYDLDNLRLNEVMSLSGGAKDQVDLRVVYSLEHLLLHGQCTDYSRRTEPPAGLQLIAGAAPHAHQQDTIVMQNLGYFQLKAQPGIWDVRIMPNYASEVYMVYDPRTLKHSRKKRGRVSWFHGNSLKDRDRDVEPGELEMQQYAMRSFRDSMVHMSVKRRAGMGSASLLEGGDDDDGTMPSTAGRGDADASSGLWGSISGLFGSDDGAQGDAKVPAALAELTPQQRREREARTVHIFSVASGHLYERFLKIMMLSVIRNTKAPVKFWYIKNFLSPKFKNSVQQMAEAYDFEVELVTYKWPAWLRGQREKQRLIWGYKILFLDVLFPLKLPRVIFIDADQVVRGDVDELWRMDLRGAPYAYTPFCDSNKDTEGFRFWKQGYWKNHLKGKPYHISALYVIDLKRFRKLRAGDNLRMVYDNLSQDPGSLANLDQDLPNFAQHMVPIYSLPQEWLWCQTWCSMDTLPDAKTIDLCNNPLTKEPKLDVARRLLPEWVKLDEDARAIEEKLEKERKSQASATQAVQLDAIRNMQKSVL